MFHVVHRIEECPKAFMGINQEFGDPTANHISQVLQSAGAPVRLAYMSRAEYEDSEVMADSVNSLAKSVDDLVVLPHRANKDDFNSYFLGTRLHLRKILPDWDKWADTTKPDTLLPTHFSRGLSTHEQTIGWWAMAKEENLIWTPWSSTAEAIKRALTRLRNLS